MGWNAKGLVTPCAHAGCYYNLTTREERDFAWAPVPNQRLWEGQTIGLMIHNWCENEEAPFSCMGLITVDQVFEEAMKMYKNA